MTTNTPILSNPQYISTLSDVASLVSVEIHLPSFTKTDKEVTQRVTAEERASASAGRFNKSLLAGNKEYTALSNYRSTVDAWLKSMTYDWAGDLRLLPASRRGRFVTEYEKHKAEWDRLANAFYDSYLDAIAAAAFTQGNMFKREDYPDIDKLRRSGRIAFDLYEQPVPSDDFRSMVGSEAVQDAVRDLQIKASQYVTQMAERQVKDFAEVLDSLIKACSTETKVDDKGKIKVVRGRLYETTFKKALEYAETLESMNITGDPRLTMLRTDINRILNMDYEKLSESDTLRVTVREELTDLRGKLSFNDEE